MSHPRAIVRGFVAGRWDGVLAAPLALHVAARIAERDPEGFVYDPTQLANALRDLVDAVQPDAVVVTDSEILAAGIRTADGATSTEVVKVALEGTRRLRSTYGDAVALAAIMPSPETLSATLRIDAAVAVDIVLCVGKEFLGAGADVVIVDDALEASGASLGTLANIARFHQALAVSHATPRYGLPATTVVDLGTPSPATGLVSTSGQLPRDTDISQLRDWVESVRSASRTGHH
jgi:hypothetical protein